MMLINRKQAFWVVRAGGKGNEEKYVLDSNLFTIAWNGLSDLSKFKDKTSLMKYYRQINSNENENQTIQAVAQVWDFVNDIKIDDFVLIPLLSRKDRRLAIGRVTGDYSFKELTPKIKHIRSVEWLHKDFPYSEFDKETRQNLGLHRTVYQIRTPEVINSIKNILEKYGVMTDTKKQIEQEDEKNNYILSMEELSEYLSMPIQNLKVMDELLKDKNSRS